MFWRDRCKPANPSSISRAKQNTPAIERPPAESPKRCRPAVAWLRLGPGKLPGPSLYSPTALEPMAPQPCPRLADKILTGFAKNTLSFCSFFLFCKSYKVLITPPTLPPYLFMHRSCGAMEVTKPYRFIGFGAMEFTKHYKCSRLGAMEVTTPPMNLWALGP